MTGFRKEQIKEMADRVAAKHGDITAEMVFDEFRSCGFLRYPTKKDISQYLKMIGYVSGHSKKIPGLRENYWRKVKR